MKAVVQRVSKATVTVGEEIVARIGKGIVILLGVKTGDTEDTARWLARKCAALRIFEDSEGHMNLGLADVDGAALVVSQFTLYGDCDKGKRPSFTEAASAEVAQSLYGVFVETLRNEGVSVKTGRFQAKMLVEIMNDGPVTLTLER